MLNTTRKTDEPRISRATFLNAHNFLEMVKRSPTLTPQQKRTLRGQALHGDLEGAMRGYKTLVCIKEGSR